MAGSVREGRRPGKGNSAGTERGRPARRDSRRRPPWGAGGKPRRSRVPRSESVAGASYSRRRPRPSTQRGDGARRFSIPKRVTAAWRMRSAASSGESVASSRSTVLGRDGAGGHHPPAEEVEDRLPVVDPHQHQRKVLDLAGLDQGRGLEHLVEGAEAAGQGDEGVGVLDQHHLADEEVAELDEGVEVGVGALLVRQLDVAADRAAAGVPRAAVGRLHDPRAAAGHHREAVLGQPPADLAGQPVVAVVLAEARRAEDGDAGADEMKLAKAVEELPRDAQNADQFRTAAAGAGEQPPLVGVAGYLAPAMVAAGAGRCLAGGFDLRLLGGLCHGPDSIAVAFAGRRSPLQVVDDELRHQLVHLIQHLAVGGPVPALRIERQLIALARLGQLVDELDRVLQVDVVVDGAVEQQQLAVEVGRRAEDRGLLVALGVVLRDAPCSARCRGCRRAASRSPARRRSRP